MVGNRHKGPTDDEPDSGSARSSDDMAPDDRRFGDGNTGTFPSPWCTNPPQIPFPFIAPHFSIPSSRELGSTSRKLGYCVPDKAKRRKRQTRSSINAMTNEGKDIMRLLAELKDQMREQSMQLTESNSEIHKQMGNLIESQNGQSKEMEKLMESQNGQSKVLEKLIESQNGQSKELEKLTASIRKQLEFHTNITGHAESDAPRSQMNQVPTHRYRLEFKSVPTGKIITGETIDISVALVETINGRTVENGPLASGTVELVVVNAKFNRHNGRHYWHFKEFEDNIMKPREGVDQSVKSIVSNGQFNLNRGVRCYSGSSIFENSHNMKVRLGAMLVLPTGTGERVLEALSGPLLVRDHVQSGKQCNLHPNSSNGQRQGLGDNDYQEENSSMPNMQQPSWPNSTHTGGIRSNIIGGQSQLPFLGTSNMLSTEPFTSQEQQSSIQQYQSPHVPMVAQATYNQNDELAWPSNYLVRDSNFMGNDHVLDHAIDMQFPTIMPLQLVWDRPNVGPIKCDWNLLDQLMPLPKFNNCGLVTKLLMQEHLVSRTIMSKEVMQARRNIGVIIEPLEPDDSDEECQLKRKMRRKYQLRFVNKVCEGYHIMDPIKADDGSLLKVALFDGNRKITNGPLSSASVQITALHGDFNDHGLDYWTSEEFNCYEVCPWSGEEASLVLGGYDCILVLSDGEACLGDVFFQMISYCARTGKFKLGARLASAQEERIQEAVSESFWVKDRHYAGECGLGIGPEDDTARINHPSVVQATMAELVTGPLLYTLKNKASSYRYNVMEEGMEDVLDDGTFLHDIADAVEEADGKLKEINERRRRYGLDGRVAMATPAATPSSMVLMQEHLVSRTIMSKEVMQARPNTGVIIEPHEPDDSDEGRQLKRKMLSKYQLRFENKVCEGYHIMDPIKADDGNLLKVALFDGNRKITHGPLSSASVQIIVLHGDFNEHGQDYWTLEEFSRYEVCLRPGEEAPSVLGGDCILVLSDGEACLGDAFFQMTSYCTRTGKFRMGVRLASAQEERIQEGVSESFWVKDRHCAAAGIRSKIQTMEKSRYFSFDKLETITKYFAEERKLGHGSYGVVYKGVQDDGEVIAVKKLHSDLRGITDAAFDDEILNLSKVDHPNVVRVIGYCHEARRQFLEKEGQIILAFGIERLLCFEYVEGGSLDKHISDEICDLDWPTCYRIIRGTCEGLNHLHTAQERPIYHLDLKPANILLDKDMTAKIGDLGLSKLVASSETHKTEVLKGTQGYMPPEYINDRAVSKKFDVFSLGVIIIKMMAGNRGRREMPPDQFIKFVTDNWKERMQGTPKRLLRETNIQQVKTCVDIALRCVNVERNGRPSIKDIVNELEELEAKIKKMTLSSDQSKGHIVEQRSSDSNVLAVDPPLELRFLFETRKDISCCLQLTNKTDGSIAFNIMTNQTKYRTEPKIGTLPPCSKCYVSVTLRAQEEAPLNMQCHDMLIVQCVSLSEGLTESDEISEEFFKKVMAEKVVDVVKLPIVYVARDQFPR